MTTDSLTAAISANRTIELNHLSSGIAATVFAILVLVILSALLAASRAGFYALSPSDRKGLSPRNKVDGRILELLKSPEKLRATIIVLCTFLNVAVIILSSGIFYEVIRPAFSRLTGFILLVLLVSVIILFFCEILPKIYGSQHPFPIVRLMAFPLFFLEKIISPVNYFLIRLSSLIERHNTKTQKNISVDEISQALELTSEGEITEDKEILEGIVNFGSKNVVEIMCPRVDVVAIDVKSSLTKVLGLINSSGYSRIPVYSESFDQMKGILFIKDLLPHTDKGDDFRWQSLLRPPFFVPETKKVKDLLEDFQKNKVHLAVVVDEYGGSSGIVSLEDVLEEIVGEIADEFDEEEKFFTRIGEKKFMFDGKIQLDDFIHVLGCRENYFEEVKGEADTLAGLILEIRGEIPANHDKIEYKDYRFTVESISNRRIRQVKVEMI